MDMSMEICVDPKNSLNSPSELYERTHDVPASLDPTVDVRSFDMGWESFPGLLPA